MKTIGAPGKSPAPRWFSCLPNPERKQSESFPRESPIAWSERDIMKKSSETDWKSLASMADGEIDYSDLPPLPDSFFEHAKVWRSRPEDPEMIHTGFNASSRRPHGMSRPRLT